MKLKSNKRLILGICLFVSFLLWTVIVSVVDVRPIGPETSSVGLATVNSYLHDRIGVHMRLYELTDALSIIPLALRHKLVITIRKASFHAIALILMHNSIVFDRHGEQ